MSSWWGAACWEFSTAYHLARPGAQTLLLQADDLGGGSSAACTGRAQVAEGHLDPLNLRLIREEARLETLEAALGASFEWRHAGFLALINSKHLWDEWVARAAQLTQAGIPTEILDQAALRAAEPCLNADGFLGAAYAAEGGRTRSNSAPHTAGRRGATAHCSGPTCRSRPCEWPTGGWRRSKPEGRVSRRIAWPSCAAPGRRMSSGWPGSTCQFATRTPRRWSPSRWRSLSTTRSSWRISTRRSTARSGRRRSA